MWLILKRGYPCLISISEKSSVEIFLRNGFLNSAHFSAIGPTLKPFGLERVNKTPLALGLHGGTGFFAAGELSSKIQIYLILMPTFWHISLYITCHCQMAMFPNLLDTFTVEKQNIYNCILILQKPSGLGTRSKLVVEHISQGLFLLSIFTFHTHPYITGSLPPQCIYSPYASSYFVFTDMEN